MCIYAVVHAQKGVAVDAERRARRVRRWRRRRSQKRIGHRRVRHRTRRKPPGIGRRSPRWMRRIGGECRAGRFEEDPQSPGILPRLAVPPPVEGDRGRVHQIAARREHAQKEQVWILALDKLCELLNFIKWEVGGREGGGRKRFFSTADRW